MRYGVSDTNHLKSTPIWRSADWYQLAALLQYKQLIHTIHCSPLIVTFCPLPDCEKSSLRLAPSPSTWLPQGDIPAHDPVLVSSMVLHALKDALHASAPPPGIRMPLVGHSLHSCCRFCLVQSMSSSPFLRRRAESTPRPRSWELPSRLGNSSTWSSRTHSSRSSYD